MTTYSMSTLFLLEKNEDKVSKGRIVSPLSDVACSTFQVAASSARPWPEPCLARHEAKRTIELVACSDEVVVAVSSSAFHSTSSTAHFWVISPALIPFASLHLIYSLLFYAA
jgi:hypothetical protein